MAVEAQLDVFRKNRVRLDFTMDPVLDVTGWTLVFNVSTARDRAQKLIDDKAMSVTSGPDGTFSVTLTAAETDLAAGQYFWDVTRVDMAEETTLALGVFRVIGVAKAPG